MDLFVLLVTVGPLVCVVVVYNLAMFLWQGQHLFREMRRRIAAAQVCTKCGREILVSGAKFCGRCGGQLVKAA